MLKINTLVNLRFWILSLLLVILTFPIVAGDFSYGLDCSYFWAHNYLFDTHKDLSKISLIYGPLAFIRHPYGIGANVVYGIIFLCALKAVVSFFAFKINEQFKQLNIYLIFIALFLFHCISPAIDYLFLVLILQLVFLHYKIQKNYLLFAAVVIVVQGFFIKNSIGISGAVSCGYYIIVELLIRNKKFKLVLCLIGVGIILLFIQGLLLFHNFTGLFEMFQNYYYSTAGFSENMSLLGGKDSFVLLLIMAVFYFLQFRLIRDKIFQLFWFSTFLAVFSIFKHSMVRCDGGHYYSVFIFYLQLMFLLLLILREVNLRKLVLLFIPLIAYYANLTNQWSFNEFQLPLTNGTYNLYHFISEYKTLNKQWKTITNNNAANNPTLTLSNDALTLIGDKTIDFYPWELSYAWKNKINWKPRNTMQSLTMHQYFDKKSAKYFSSEDAPEFLIWHLNNKLYGWKTDFSSIDERYLFSDDPYTTTSILKAYTPVKIENGNLILKRQARKVLIKEEGNSADCNIQQWIFVPEKKNYITTMSLKIKEKPMRKLKRFAFRDEIYWITFLTDKGELIKNRVSTSFLQGDVWASIYVKNIDQKLDFERVKQIKISSENETLNYSKAEVKWNYLRINDSAICDTCESIYINQLFLGNTQ